MTLLKQMRFRESKIDTTVMPDDKNYGPNELLEQVISTTCLMREISLLLAMLCKSLQIKTRHDDLRKKFILVPEQLNITSINDSITTELV